MPFQPFTKKQVQLLGKGLNVFDYDKIGQGSII